MVRNGWALLLFGEVMLSLLNQQNDDGPDPDEIDEVERLFPIERHKLGRRAKWLAESNDIDGASHHKPGEIRFHSPSTTPVRIYYWPDSSSIDQARGREISSAWGMTFQKSDMQFLVIASGMFDNLGNRWCYVSAIGDGRMGWVHSNNLITSEEFKKEFPKFR